VELVVLQGRHLAPGPVSVQDLALPPAHPPRPALVHELVLHVVDRAQQPLERPDLGRGVVRGRIPLQVFDHGQGGGKAWPVLQLVAGALTESHLVGGAHGEASADRGGGPLDPLVLDEHVPAQGLLSRPILARAKTRGRGGADGGGGRGGVGGKEWRGLGGRRRKEIRGRGGGCGAPPVPSNNVGGGQGRFPQGLPSFLSLLLASPLRRQAREGPLSPSLLLPVFRPHVPSPSQRSRRQPSPSFPPSTFPCLRGYRDTLLRVHGAPAGGGGHRAHSPRALPGPLPAALLLLPFLPLFPDGPAQARLHSQVLVVGLDCPDVVAQGPLSHVVDGGGRRGRGGGRGRAGGRGRGRTGPRRLLSIYLSGKRSLSARTRRRYLLQLTGSFGLGARPRRLVRIPLSGQRLVLHPSPSLPLLHPPAAPKGGNSAPCHRPQCTATPRDSRLPPESRIAFPWTPPAASCRPLLPLPRALRLPPLPRRGRRRREASCGHTRPRPGLVPVTAFAPRWAPPSLPPSPPSPSCPSSSPAHATPIRGTKGGCFRVQRRRIQEVLLLVVLLLVMWRWRWLTKPNLRLAPPPPERPPPTSPLGPAATPPGHPPTPSATGWTFLPPRSLPSWHPPSLTPKRQPTSPAPRTSGGHPKNGSGLFCWLLRVKSRRGHLPPVPSDPSKSTSLPRHGPQRLRGERRGEGVSSSGAAPVAKVH
jgi:hypothetical protein